MDILDCPVKDLPSKGGRFTNIKKSISALHAFSEDSDKITIRYLLDGYLHILRPTAVTELLYFLVNTERIKL